MLSKQSDTKSKPDRYITDMKELSDYEDSEKSTERGDNKKEGNKTEEYEQKLTLNESEKERKTENNKSLEKDKTKETVAEQENISEKNVKGERKIINKPYTSKDLILAFINAVSIILLVLILKNISSKSSELKGIRNEIFSRGENPISSTRLTEENLEKLNSLKEFFLDEVGIVAFVNDVEELKVNGGASISKVSFTNQNAIQDKTGNFGYPVIIEFRGRWDQISSDLEKVEKLHYLFRTVDFDSSYNEKEDLYELNYGIIIYIKNAEVKN